MSPTINQRLYGALRYATFPYSLIDCGTLHSWSS